MSRLMVVGAAAATLLIWHGLWPHAAVFVAVYVLLIEFLRRFRRGGRGMDFRQVEAVRRARAGLRKSLAKLEGKK